MESTQKTETKMKNIKKQEKQILKDNSKIKNKEIIETEKEIAEDVAKIEDKVAHHKISQEKADAEIKEDVKEKAEESSEKKSKHEEKKHEESKSKKTEAVVNGKGLAMSTKHAIAICNFIRGKNIDKAISELEKVQNKKIAVPMRGEIPHRRGRMMSGRYPVNASKIFIALLKSLKANAIVNELEFEKYKLYCNPNMDSRPYKRFGQGRHKRTSVVLKLINKEETKSGKKSKK